MTYNPNDLVTVRSYLLSKLDLQPGTARGVDLEPGEVGIMGDPAHAATGGYHEGNDDLSRVGRLNSDYSKAESPRDRPGTNAASALDIGGFDATIGGRRITLRSLSLAIVDACRRGDPRTRDIREVIYTPDGSTVRRWDRLGIRSSGDSSHLWHTHISFFRDSEGRRAANDNFLGLLVELIDGGDDMQQDERAALFQMRQMMDDFYTGNNQPKNIATWLQRATAADVAAVKATGAAQTAAITALGAALNKALAGTGGSIDVAPVLAAIEDVKRSESEAVKALQDKVAELTDRLAKAAQAQADALGNG